jgi:hypothetical protein
MTELMLTNFNDIVRQIEKSDSLTLTKAKFSDIDGIYPEDRKIGINGTEKSLSETAFKQLLTRLEIGSIYNGINRFVDFDKNAVNDMHKKIFDLSLEKRIKDRTNDEDSESEGLGLIGYPNEDRYVAITSANYQLLHDKSLLDAVINHEKWGSMDVSPTNNYATENYMQLGFLSKTEKKELKVGELLKFGFLMSNGIGVAARTQKYLYFVRCENGQLTQKVVDSEMVYHSNREIVEKMNGHINGYLSGKSFDIIQGLISKSIDRPAILESVDAMPKYLQQVGIPKKYHESIIEVFNTKNDNLPLNWWGIGNAVSYFATHEIDKIREINAKHDDDRNQNQIANELLKDSFGIMMTGVSVSPNL